jgi:peptide chain release factor subunit 1
MKNLLEKLAAFEPTGFPFINLYLNTQVNENGQRDYDVFVRNAISEHREKYAEESSERESFDRDAEKIKEFLETIRPDANSVAIFACAGADDFFRATQFDMTIDENYFHIGDRPHLYPLARMRDQHPRYAVLSADTNYARIYVFGRGGTLTTEEIQGTKTNRSEVGGWSQMRYQRHVDNFHKQHAREAVDELEKLMRDEHITRLILCGNEAVIIPLIKAELSKEFEDKVIDTLPLPVSTSEEELYEATQEAIQKYNAVSDLEKVEKLKGQNYDGGLGVVGVERTLEALQNGQVQELFLSADPNAVRYNRKKVAKVLENYAPGDEDETPDATDSKEIVDELVRLGLYSADRVTFIEDENLLKDYGGVGAILRYTI